MYYFILFHLCLFGGTVLVIFPFDLMTYHNESALTKNDNFV